MMMMMKMGKVIGLKYLTVAMFITFLPQVYSQDVIRPDVIKSATFFLDKSQDCNSNVYEVTNQVIITAPSGSTGNSVPLTCTITLRSATIKASIFQVIVQTVDIECQMNFYIFDGEETQSVLKSYSCYDTVKSPIQLVTTGNIVSFRLTRQTEKSSRYSIRLIVETIDDPLSGGGGGIIHGQLDPNKSYLRKFSTDTIIILISVAYIIAILICIIVLTVRYVRSSQEEKKWSARPLAYNNYGLPQATSGNTSNENLYTTNMYPTLKSNGRDKLYKTRMALSTEDTDSVFEAIQTNMKAQLKVASSQSSSYTNPSFQQTPPSFKRTSGRRTGTMVNASAAVPASKTHRRNPETAVKEVHKPREIVISSVSQQVQTDLEDDDDDYGVMNKVELASIGLNTDPEMTDHGIQCEVDSSDEVTNSEEMNAISRHAVKYLKQHKHLQSPSLTHGAVSDDEMGQRYEPNRHYYPSQALLNSPAMYRQAQPMEQYGSPEPHILYSDPTLRRTNITPPAYMMRVNGYGPQNVSQPPVLTNVDDRYIPVYSYLVNRGYTVPDEDKNASGSSATGTSHQSDLRMVQTDDSDFSADLGSGVELMKR